jgi:hypothetical protein
VKGGRSFGLLFFFFSFFKVPFSSENLAEKWRSAFPGWYDSRKRRIGLYLPEEARIEIRITEHAHDRMLERNITAPTALACIANGDKSPGFHGATRHYLLGYTAVTVDSGNETKIVTVYNGRPHKNIGRTLEPRHTRDPPAPVILRREFPSMPHERLV